METLEQYGIKDVTPGQRVGCSERLRGEYWYNRSMLRLYVGNEYLGIMWDAKYSGITFAGTGMYKNEEAAVWLAEVRYN